jgi:rhodanese-related sulfurtransferase
MKLFALAIRMFLGTSLVLLATATHSIAVDNLHTPPSIRKATIVSAKEAQSMLSSAIFFDVDRPRNSDDGRVPGAVPISGKWNSENTTNADISNDDIDFSKLPDDKYGKIVFYGQDVNDWKAYKATLIAVSAGYKNVYWMRGGIAEWRSEGLSSEKETPPSPPMKNSKPAQKPNPKTNPNSKQKPGSQLKELMDALPAINLM